MYWAITGIGANGNGLEYKWAKIMGWNRNGLK